MAIVPSNNPNIDGSTVDPKWIDGGPHNVPPTYAGPKFNIDDAHMWPPLSVITGLMSGYCERRAVLEPGFITGIATETVDGREVQHYTELYWGGANCDKITSYGVNNLVAGNPVDSLFYSATDSAYMQPVGVRGTTTSDYMVAMDSALTALCTIFVDKDRKPYATIGTDGFNTLAQSATTRAAYTHETASSIQLPERNGGDMHKKGYPALPVEWAKERKWMLDELRYVDIYGNIRQAISEPIDYPCLSGTYTEGASISLNVVSSAFTTLVEQRPTYIAFDNRATTGTIYAGYTLKTAIIGSVGATGEVSYCLDVPIDALGMNYEADYIDYTDKSTMYITDTRIATADDNIGAYYVLPGGHLIIPRGTLLENRPITVESSGTVEYVETLIRQPNTYYHAGSIVKYPDRSDITLYTAMSGITGTGSLPSTATIGETWLDGTIEWYIAEPNYDKAALNPSIYLHNGATFIPLLTDKNDYKVMDVNLDKLYNGHTCISFIKSGYETVYVSGATASLPAARISNQNLYVTGGAVVTLDPDDSVDWLYVDDATVTVPKDCMFDDITVANGGVVIIEAGRARDEYTDVIVLSGGIASFTNMNQHAGGFLENVTVLSGGTFSMTGVRGDYTNFSVSELALVDGARFEGVCTLEDNIPPDYLIDYLNILHFDDFGLIGASTAGWHYNTVQVTAAAQAVNTIYGTYTYNAAVSAVSDHINGSLPSNDNITLDITIAGTQYTDLDSLITVLDNRTRIQTYYGTYITAINKQGGPQADNYYPSFKCRQWYTDKNAPETP